MMQRRWWQAILVAVLLVTLVAPVRAQQPPANGITVQKTGSRDPMTGNITTIETTRLNGMRIKEEITVTRGVELIRKEERMFVNNRLAKEEILTVANGITTIVERVFQNGNLVKEERKVLNAQGQVQLKVETVFDPATGLAVRVEEESIVVQNGTIVRTEREFRLVNGVLTEVAREVETIAIVNGQRIVTKQEFELRGDELVLVQKEREAERVKMEGAKEAKDKHKDEGKDKEKDKDKDKEKDKDKDPKKDDHP